MSALEFQDLFEFFDKDGNGVISKEELRQAVQMLGHTPTESYIASLMEQVDADGDDVIDQREFAEIMTEQPKVEAVSKGSRVVQSFQVFDADLQGFLPEEDFRKMLTQYGELLGTDEVEEMLAMCPRSENGLLDYQGFVHAVENASSTVQLLSKDEA